MQATLGQEPPIHFRSTQAVQRPIAVLQVIGRYPRDGEEWSRRSNQLGRKSRIAAAISAACVSSAKCPVSKKRMTAPGMSRLKASAPGGRKNGSFLPHTARNGGLWARK